MSTAVKYKALFVNRLCDMFRENKHDRSGIPENNRKLLIIDDDKASRILIHTILYGTTITIIDADSGKEALRLFKQCPEEIGLVFLDIRLPDCEGWGLIKPLRSENPQVLIVALSAINPDDLEQRCKEEGLEAFLSKPVSIKKVRSFVDFYLNS